MISPIFLKMNIISGLIIWLKKDYNHPSVIIYSVGNEIQEAGTKQGALDKQNAMQ